MNASGRRSTVTGRRAGSVARPDHEALSQDCCYRAALGVDSRAWLFEHARRRTRTAQHRRVCCSFRRQVSSTMAPLSYSASFSHSASFFRSASLLLSFSVLAAASCRYDFSGPNDVAFLMDYSGSISDANVAQAKQYIRSLIRNRMLIGPESNYSRLAFMPFYLKTYSPPRPDYVSVRVPRFVSRTEQPYECEFFAPGGVFDSDVRRTEQPDDVRADDPGFKEALQSLKTMLVGNSDAARRKIVFLLTDFHFEKGRRSDLAKVVDAARELRWSLEAAGGELVVYGVGIGDYFNATNMDKVLAAANGLNGPACGKTVERWFNYLTDQGTLPVKGVAGFGPRRGFLSAPLCCYLCHEQDAARTYARCSLEEFRSGLILADVRIPGLAPLMCTSTGDPDQCSQTTPPVVVTPHGPEGPPDGPGTSPPSATPPSGGGSGGEPEGSPEKRSDTGSGLVSTLIVIFVLVNLAVIVSVIIVCIYSAKLQAPRKYKQKQRSQNPSSFDNQGLSGSESGRYSNVTQPTRAAPAPPIPANTCHDNDYLSADPQTTQEDYVNNWVAEENRINLSRLGAGEGADGRDAGDAADFGSPGCRTSYLQAFKEDVAASVKNFRQWTNNVRSRIVYPSSNYENSDVIEELHSSRRQSVFRRQQHQQQQQQQQQQLQLQQQQRQPPDRVQDELLQKLNARRLKIDQSDKAQNSS